MNESAETVIQSEELLKLNPKQLKNFWKKIVKTDNCWEWIGARNKLGYGSFGIDGKTQLAHRISYRINKGQIPIGMCVLHRCDNPPCCNPDHLWIGTDFDNSADMILKGRDKKASPEHNGGGGKLNSYKIIEIRKAYAAGGTTKEKLAAQFHVSGVMISRIVHLKSWVCV
jgi:hypothetical protein